MWEYESIYCETMPDFVAKANELGKRGWEFVKIYDREPGTYLGMMKRFLDPSRAKVHADWLEEHNQPEAASLLRKFDNE